MSGFINNFVSLYVPMLRFHEHAFFGSTVEYLPDYDSSRSFQLVGIWKEGVEGESLSPGRYSVFWVATDAIPDRPKRGDGVQKGDKTYDVVDVNASANGESRLLLQENIDG